MELYFVNTNPQPNGDHEVHKSTCSYMPDLQHQLRLGYFYNCHDAVKEAKKIYPNTADGCHSILP